MKTIKIMKVIFFLFILVSGFLLMQSCAISSASASNKLPVSDIVKMSRDKVPARDIIRDIRKSHMVYDLSASQFAKLESEGVSDSVVNYMQKTQLDAVRRDEQMSNSYYPGYYGPWYGGFGWPYYGYYGWGMGPIIIYHGSGGYHGGSHGGRR